jgi:hypothetical protein
MTAQNITCESGEHVIDVYRCGILADWYVPVLILLTIILLMSITRVIHQFRCRYFYLSEQEDEENFDLSLISCLKADVIPCLGGDRVPDYLITQFVKVLQQGSQLLLNESDDDEHPPTPTSLTIPDAKPAARGDEADGERM